MLSYNKTTRLFLACAFLGISNTLLPEETSIPSDNSTLSEQVSKANPNDLKKVLESSMGSIFAVKNTFAMTIKLTKKFGKKIKNKEDAVKKILEATQAFDTFIAIKMKPIQHYFQQDHATIPTDAYAEIYGTYDVIIKTATRLVQELNKYVNSNFTQDFDFNFLMVKDTLIIDEYMTPEIVIKNASLLQKEAENLFESSNRIGLTQWNKVRQALNKTVVQPCAKYHLLEVAGISIFVATSLLFLYWVSYGTHLQTTQEKAHEDAAKESLTAQKEAAKFPKLSAINESNDNNTVNQSTKNTDTNIWFASLRNGFHAWVQSFCGTVPDTGKNGLWHLDKENPKTVATTWNKLAVAMYNFLHQNPISTVIYSTYGLLFSSYVNPLILPALKNSVQNWWQQSLGGSFAEMRQRGTFEEEAEITFDNVIGLDHIKARLEAAIAYAKDPSKYAQIGDIATNYIFYGVKRTGKSFFAKAIAGEMKKLNPDMKILNIPCAIFRELGVEKTIDLIRSYAPCVAFIDEVDIAGFSRSMDRQTTGELLKAMGAGNISPSPDKPVFLLFATNKLESIDTSLASLGRFGASILFTTPSFIDRIQFVFAILQATGQNPENFDIQRLAEKTEGNSFEDVKYCITQAALIATLRNTQLTTELIMEVMNEILEGIYPEYPIELDAETREVIAAHFAGKALITMLTNSHELLDSVTIHKRKLPLIEDEWAGYSGKPTRQLKFEYGALLKRQQTTTENILGPKTRKTQLMRILAGPVAEEIILGASTYSCHASSLVAAYENLIAQCSEGGIVYRLDTVMSNEQKGQYFEKARTLMEEYKKEVCELLGKHRKALEVMTRALLLPALGGTLSDGLVSMIINNPEAIDAELDIVEKQQQEFEQKQREEYERLREERMTGSIPQEAA